ncbi:MAG: hypothetical protein JW738_10585 [Actinobacteria bacterium]|nr:hypothetical protein [Actinomycetota bacterium]
MINDLWKRFKDSTETDKPPKRKEDMKDTTGLEDPESKEKVEPEESVGEKALSDSDEPDTDSEDGDVSGPDAVMEKMQCPNCGSDIDGDSKFCNECGAQIMGVKEEEFEGEPPPGGIEPWAMKIAEWFKKIPTSVKIVVPLLVIFIIGGLVALLVIAGNHSPAANVEKYLSHIKVGEYKDAYNMITHSEGQFSSFDYFKGWQLLQVDELGRLQGFDVRDRQHENSIFGKVISDDSEEGMSFTATLRYRKTTYDIRIDVESAGGTWPARQYKLRLAEVSTRIVASPVGSIIEIDGKKVGEAEQSEALSDALSLGDLPNDLDSAIEYVGKVINVGRSAVDEFKRLMVQMNEVANEAQWIFDRFSTSNYSWGSVADSVDRIVQQSKDLGLDITRMVMKIYWIFGGGNDGTVRADLTRTETGLDLSNLPEGLHAVKVSLPGCKTMKETFYAPDGTTIALEPTKETEQRLAKAVNDYYIIHIDAVRNLNAEALKAVTDDKLLESETQDVLDLLGKGQHEVSMLKSLKYDEFKMLSEDIATVKTREKWAINTYQGYELVSALASVSREVTYTLELGSDGVWKVIEKKVD